MECKSVRKMLVWLVDEDLPAAAREALAAHLSACRSCSEQWAALTLPKKIGRTLPPAEAPAYFHTRVVARLRSESQSASPWNIILALERHVVPALAAITLVFVSTFAYLELQAPKVDIYQAYDSIFSPGDRPQRMIIAEPNKITEETILQILSEEEMAPRLPVRAVP
jgi:anti-sigma factor RsiW